MKNILLILLFLIAFPVKAEKIGYITDVHIGKEKVKSSENGLSVYPKTSKKLFDKYLKLAKKQNLKTVIIGGDVGNRSYISKKLQKLKIQPIFVNGNHDSQRGYFIVDKGDYQIIILDTNQGNIQGQGGIDEEQKSWLQDNLSKPTLIAMHHSVFNKHDNFSFFSDYDFLKTLPNVRLVMMGHNHIEHSESFGNILFFSANPFSANKQINSYLIEQFSVR